jgi:hypothetical protein
MELANEPEMDDQHEEEGAHPWHRPVLPWARSLFDVRADPAAGDDAE